MTAGGEGSLPRLYLDLAPWFPLVTPPEEYAEEAELYRRVIIEASPETPRTLLELGSGGGNNASHYKRHFTATLVDLSEAMLSLSRVLNPECEHIVGDMRTVRLSRAFDVVFAHDALSYVTSEDDLRSVIETAFAHCRPGAIALFVPDYVRETFRPSTLHGGHDGADGRAVRYVEWTWDPDPSDSTYRTDFAYLLREPGGDVRAVHDTHICGMFARQRWIEELHRAGFVSVQSHATGLADDSAQGQTMVLARRPG